eukprot:3272223-Amphidinium_carterae.1
MTARCRIHTDGNIVGISCANSLHITFRLLNSAILDLTIRWRRDTDVSLMSFCAVLALSPNAILLETLVIRSLGLELLIMAVMSVKFFHSLSWKCLRGKRMTLCQSKEARRAINK